MNLKKRFDELAPKQKKTVIWLIIAIIFLALTFTGYNSSQSDKVASLFTLKKTREIQIEPDLIQKTMLGEQRRELDELKKKVGKIEKERSTVDNPAETTEQRDPEQPLSSDEDLPVIPSADQIARVSPLAPPTPAEQEWPKPLSTPMPPPKESRMIGEISVISNPVPTGETAAKKKGRTVYLPPSFMEAKLLTGFDASTSGNGKNNPEPLLLRIQTPAVLPNDIKANLKGCFVIAEAVGRLDKERADVRLVSLSCLSNEGKAIIDTQIKGFVTDSDSKVGLSGRVVSRMGATTARTIVAGFFGGMGDMMRVAATTQSTSAFGTTSTVDSTQVAKYGVGGGLSEGAASLHDFYLSLAKQTTPVIEVGASKKITVIVSEGKELEIGEFEHDESL